MWKCLKCQQVIMCDWKEKDKEKELHQSDCGIRVVQDAQNVRNGTKNQEIVI